MALQNFQLLSLGNVLEKKLSIPSYQREYAWEKGEYEDLWNDLTDTIDSEPQYKHFLGQVVTHSKDGVLTIIDGQQRITTCSILLSCLIHVYSDLYDDLADQASKEAKKMSRNINKYEDKIGIQSEESFLNQNPNLSQNEADNEFYIKALLRDDSLKKKQLKKSQEKMRKATNYFYEKIKGLLKDQTFDEKKEIIETYAETLLNRFQLMYIEATELDEAFTIFETLNARGKDLASADLLKNHLFTTGRDPEASNVKWNKILDTLEDVDMTKYIRAFWNSRHDFIREKVLYKTISSFVRNKKESKDFLDELGDYCSVYHDLVKPDSAIYFQNQLLVEALKGLSTLNASTFYPIVLSMVSRKENGAPVFSETDIAKVVKKIESYVFRNAVICGQTANTTETFFAEIARNIYGEELATVDEIIDKVKEKMVDDSAFQVDFEGYVCSSGNKERIRYIFRKIHKFLSPADEININTSEVHIEHIMPEDKAQWPEISDEDHEEYLWRLGNLCLLSGPINISISNKPFSEKKMEAYAVSKIDPNKDLLKFNEWNKDSIIQRQKDLYSYAAQIWSK